MTNNASPSSFGWDFQTNAAIYIALDNIEDLEYIRVEGETEDIEIKLHNDKYIYSQAKSIVEFEDYRNVINKLKKALKTLSNASKNGNYAELIYVTNTPNPFNNIETMAAFYGPTNRKFDEIPVYCKEKIVELLKQLEDEDFDIRNLSIRVLPFHTSSDSERYKVIKEKTQEFLSATHNILNGKGEQVLKIWQSEFFFNSTQTQTSLTINKSKFIWPIIVLQTELDECDNDFAEFDEGEIEEILFRYRELINYSIDRFELSLRILSDYHSYPKYKSAEKLSRFVDDNWSDYKAEFMIDGIDENVLELVIKFVIKKIVKRRHQINSLKKKVNL